MFICSYCGKKVKTQKGLQQHHNQSLRCQRLMQAGSTLLTGSLPISGAAVNQEPPHLTRKRLAGADMVAGAPENVETREDPRPVPEVLMADENRSHSQSPVMFMQDDNDSPQQPRDDSTGTSSSLSGSDSMATRQYEAPQNSQVSTEALVQFLQHRDHMAKEYFPFTKHEITAIKLMDILRNKRATLDTCEAVMDWHLKESGTIMSHMGVGDYPHYVSRKKLMKKLMGRYLGKDVKELFHSKRTKLPVSGTNVDIIYHDARDCVVSLLTDPRFTDDDYQHFGNDPLAPPTR